MSKLRMNISIAALALVACVALPELAAQPVPKERGSKARELQAAKAQAQPVKPITTGGLKGPDVRLPPKPTDAAVKPGASK
jgi:hypothetical protein